ncbi:Methylcrotonoyl-CoA carboxylase subunit alpha, mitochondrial [Toxocara canis]|uniref:Methylcrotonoyl-CoA carboxylase subunit alpha, mitochondrial n=1 Tax=Toxocara canis TaxID=6265 RepID=A0A0B2UPA1_TOXCA|nr:Methylcrotonoyl-CoA carboxylase subunit alpha, mitochondrial [Toxocara canis]
MVKVEHPVTEAITGTDLVEWQFKVAEGEKLPLRQDEIQLNGHALEARVYAEDTKAGFIPIAGHLKHVSFPTFARVDTGIEEGDEVSMHYDPMIAKGNVYTEFIADHEKDLFDGDEHSALNVCESVIARLLLQQKRPSLNDPFKFNDYFRLNHRAKGNVEIGGKTYAVQFEGSDICVDVGNKSMKLNVDEIERKQGCVLFTMNCDGQRWRRKAISTGEKIMAPAPGLNMSVRRRLGESAVRAAKAVGYVGAGTVEFIMDRSGEFFFMEMNTRLQVEHPVTEAITGTDLVEWQFKVAEGEKLPLRQDEIQLNGHALEARVYAEDTKAGFIPIAGHLKHVSFPTFARVDTGIEEGDEVSMHYDPMIAKVIVWAEDRTKAIAKLSRALQETHIGGLSTNVSFVRTVLTHPEFMKGNVYTEFIADHEKDLFDGDEHSALNVCESVIARLLLQQKRPSLNDPFKFNDYFRLNHRAKGNVEIGGKTYAVQFEGSDICVDVGNKSMKLNVDEIERKQGCVLFTMNCDGQRWRRKAISTGEKIMVFGEKHGEYALPSALWAEELNDASGMADACAPMPGVVEKVLVKVGDRVKHGQALVVMVAMKMEYIIRAPCDAIIHSVQCVAGTNVPKNAHLVKFDRP